MAVLVFRYPRCNRPGGGSDWDMAVVGLGGVMGTLKSLALALTCYIVIVIAGAAFVGWGEYTWPSQWASTTRGLVFYEGLVIVAAVTALLRVSVFKAGK